MVTGKYWDNNMSADKPIKYVRHPLSAEDKALIMSQGFKILDIKFKPADLVEDEKPAKKKQSKKA